MAFAIIAAAIFGTIIGSFLNVVAWRLPRGESLTKPRSRCPECGHQIRAYDNVPVISWLILRGRCRDCGHPISARYPLVEALLTPEAKVARALDAIEASWIAHLNGPLDMAQIAVGCALAYLDFRHAARHWREGRPQLAAWEATFARRPAMQATKPPAA